MGVYIQGMEMPKGRPVCIIIDAAGQARRYDLNNDRYADDKLFEAVSVPPHGRLIDADAITYKKIMLDGDDFYYSVTMPYICRMPTVIPASEEGE